MFDLWFTLPATLVACVLILIDADPTVRNLFTRRHK